MKNIKKEANLKIKKELEIAKRRMIEYGIWAKFCQASKLKKEVSTE